MSKIFRYLFLTIIFLFSLGQLQRVQLSESIVFYLHDLFVVFWMWLIWIKHRSLFLKKFKKYSSNFLWFTISIWIIIGLSIAYLSDGFSLTPILYLVRTVTYLLFGLSMSVFDYSDKNRRHWIMGGIIIAILGMLQYLFLPDTRLIRLWGWDDHFYRLISTQLDPNFTGIILTLTFILIQSINYRSQILKTGLSLFLAASILFTYSRASYLSFIISLLIIIGLDKSHRLIKKLAIILGLFMIAIPFLPRPAGEGVKLERTASISARIESNQKPFTDLRPVEYLAGRGLFTYHQERPIATQWPNTAHFPSNLFIFIFTSTGIVGLILSILVIYKSGNYLYQKDVFIFTSFIAILIHSQFNHTLFQPFVWLWLTGQIFLTEKSKT
mgnify:CR=1 FL=1